VREGGRQQPTEIRRLETPPPEIRRREGGREGGSNPSPSPRVFLACAMQCQCQQWSSVSASSGAVSVPAVERPRVMQCQCQQWNGSESWGGLRCAAYHLSAYLCQPCLLYADAAPGVSIARASQPIEEDAAIAEGFLSAVPTEGRCIKLSAPRI
jgi:hypothetical protein